MQEQIGTVSKESHINRLEKTSDIQYSRPPEALMEQGSGKSRSSVINRPGRSELFATPGKRHINEGLGGPLPESS